MCLSVFEKGEEIENLLRTGAKGTKLEFAFSSLCIRKSKNTQYDCQRLLNILQGMYVENDQNVANHVANRGLIQFPTSSNSSNAGRTSAYQNKLFQYSPRTSFSRLFPLAYQHNNAVFMI
jgi:hypothetical protein